MPSPSISSRTSSSFREFQEQLVRLQSANDNGRSDWIRLLCSNSWYLAMQARKLRAAPPHLRAEFLSEAQTLFAVRLWKNPTLGLPFPHLQSLPAYVNYHCRSIASSLLRQHARDRLQLADLSAIPAVSRHPSVELAELIGRMDEALDDAEWLVALLRWHLNWTLAEASAGLGLSLAQVRLRESRARQKLWTSLTLDGGYP